MNLTKHELLSRNSLSQSATNNSSREVGDSNATNKVTGPPSERLYTTKDRTDMAETNVTQELILFKEEDAALLSMVAELISMAGGP